ncbi:MAG: amidohydrolase family protein, partial [Clostridia bacterium]|nr:amidohydrolase family protein [Clostridia bacterium]
MYQLVIKNGIIIDGTGSPSFRADVAIENGRIARIAKGLKGEREIDATGLTVTPGFIDSHAHNDSMIFTYPEQREKIEQGITTSVAGTCGSTEAPLSR